MAAVAITRTELDASGLRRAAGRSRDAAAARRMLALAAVLEGSSRMEAARSAGMDRQTLRDWVHCYNEQGIAGLSDKRGKSGRSDGCRWRGKGECGRAQCGALAPSGLGARHRGAFRGGPGRTQRRCGAAAAGVPAAHSAAPASRAWQRGASIFQAEFQARVDADFPETARGKPLELWWQDEARVGQQGTLNSGLGEACQRFRPAQPDGMARRG